MALKFNTLQEWLDWQESLHHQEIDLGLTRVTKVLKKLFPEFWTTDNNDNSSKNSFQQNLPFTLITVGGTNGKGSSVAILESILIASGYRVGSYTTPHFISYNERIRINADCIEDQALCQAFEAIEQVRGEISLTTFEFATLAALYLFQQQYCEVVILEVGLGGRLDSVNILDADCSLVTTVALDHQDWLGDDLESIGFEKAGIYRSQHPAIYGDFECPQSLKNHCKQIDAQLIQMGRDYSYQKCEDSENGKVWELLLGTQSLGYFPQPNLIGDLQIKNAANSLMVLNCLNTQLTRVSPESIAKGLQQCQLTGRYQQLASQPQVIVDVAHNPQAAEMLAQYLSSQPCEGKTHAIFAILSDKDIPQVIASVAPFIDDWHLIDLNVARSIGAEKIANIVSAYANTQPPTCYNDFFSAYQSIIDKMTPSGKQQDRIIVFGSFFTVTCALAHFGK